MNGTTSFDPSLDDATELLTQAHAVSIVAGIALDDDLCSSELIRSAMRGVTTLLETGIRCLEQGHEDMVRQLVRH